MGRLGLPEKLKKHSFGIISAHADAVHSGVCKAICDALPFETAGFACDSQSPNGETGIYMMSIMILTADDCRFVSKHTKPLFGEEGGGTAPLIKECFAELKAAAPEPKLCLAYVPHNSEHFPGEYLDAIAELDPQVPVFGAVSTDMENIVGESPDGVITIHNGVAFADSVVFVFIEGNLAPRFFKSTFNDKSMKLKDMGEVTKCDRNMLLEIDNTPAVDFLKKIGFFGGDVNDSNTDNLKVTAATATATFIFDYDKGVDVSRTFTEFVDNGGIVCMGHVHKGAMLSLALAEPSTVTETTRDVVDEIKDSGVRTVLIYSCIGRRVGLMNEPMKELETIKAIMPGGINYMVGYASGELCPTSLTPGNVHNHEHNQTLIACVF
jgi:hypothetical protein